MAVSTGWTPLKRLIVDDGWAREIGDLQVTAKPSLFRDEAYVSIPVGIPVANSEEALVSALPALSAELERVQGLVLAAIAADRAKEGGAP